MYTPDPNEKFDYQNMDTKLFLALRTLCVSYKSFCDSGQWGWSAEEQPEHKAAMRAMYEFQQSLGPLPDWAVDRNWAYELVPGAQLCTRDGRKTGNAHIIRHLVADNPFLETTHYECLSDAGNKFIFTELEIMSAFTIGDWLSDPARVLKDFDRNKEFSTNGK